LEWVKLYGLLTDREEEANAFFREQAKAFETLSQSGDTGKKVAFFYLTPSGAANVRKSSDYVAKLIELAGGHYAFSDLPGEEENALSTQNLQMEAFYAAAQDADVLIYNGTVDGGVDSLAALLGKSELLEQFKAVQTGNVWCTRQNLFQQPTGVCGLLEDFRTVLTDEEAGRDELNFLRRLQ
jgi:iron complex transport system substrate-binding protein